MRVMFYTPNDWLEFSVFCYAPKDYVRETKVSVTSSVHMDSHMDSYNSLNKIRKTVITIHDVASKFS